MPSVFAFFGKKPNASSKNFVSFTWFSFRCHYVFLVTTNKPELNNLFHWQVNIIGGCLVCTDQPIRGPFIYDDVAVDL